MPSIVRNVQPYAQEACEEDISRNDSEHVAKMAELRKKEEACLKKKEDEFSKLFDELTQKKIVSVYSSSSVIIIEKRGIVTCACISEIL